MFRITDNMDVCMHTPGGTATSPLCGRAAGFWFKNTVNGVNVAFCGKHVTYYRGRRRDLRELSRKPEGVEK